VPFDPAAPTTDVPTTIDGYRKVADELHDLSGRLAIALTRDRA
jgi:hypothetical protein